MRWVPKRDNGPDPTAAVRVSFWMALGLAVLVFSLPLALLQNVLYLGSNAPFEYTTGAGAAFLIVGLSQAFTDENQDDAEEEYDEPADEPSPPVPAPLELH